jgi:hypothetical protein
LGVGLGEVGFGLEIHFGLGLGGAAGGREKEGEEKEKGEAEEVHGGDGWILVEEVAVDDFAVGFEVELADGLQYVRA